MGVRRTVRGSRINYRPAMAANGSLPSRGELRFSHLARITGLLSGAATHVVARFCHSGHPPRRACATCANLYAQHFAVSEPVISYMGSDGTSSVMMGGAVVGTDILGIRGDTSAAPGYIQA